MFLPGDESHLRRAIRLAMNGRGRVEPNPMVGCVLVRDGRVIGEGYHGFFGGPHAEPTALADAESRSESAAGATAYVTLEPCCHLDKKTPPCAPRLIAAGIARVVVGCLDPYPAVNGNGVAMLREAGIAVDGPLLEAECKQLIAPFLARVNHHRPYVTLKWAQSSDGRVAGRMGQRVHITNAASDRQVHLLRSRCDAITVGTNTVLSDDPLLTARGVPRLRPLLRVILSNSPERLSPSARLVQSARESPVLLFCSQSAASLHGAEADALRTAGVEVIGLPDFKSHFRFADVLTELHRRDVTHLMIEPGPTLARSMLSREPVDRIWVFKSSQPMSHDDGSRVAQVHWPSPTSLMLEGDTLTEYLNPQSDVFFALAASADLVFARSEA